MKSVARRKRPIALPVRAARILKQLGRVPGLDEGELSLHALGLAATPDERWRLWEAQMRSDGFWKGSNRTGFGSAPDKDLLHIRLIDDFLKCRERAPRP